MIPVPGGDGAAQAASGPFAGHEECRLREFVRWPRIALEHERSYLSRNMQGKAFMKPGEPEAFMHDLTDIDYVLSQLPQRVRTEVPGEGSQAG